MDNLITAIIVYDEPTNIELLEHFVNEDCPQVKILDKISKKEEAIKRINQLQPQLLFLDIVLNRGTTFDILEAITLPEVNIVFVTSYNEFALKTLKIIAVDYILKPVNIKELAKAVKKVQDKLVNKIFLEQVQLNFLAENYRVKKISNGYVAVSSLKRIDVVKTEDIIYLESNMKCSVFFMKNKKQIVSIKSLSFYESILDPTLFFRIHRSYMVNLSHIKSIDKEGGFYCKMTNQKQLPIAKRRLKMLHVFLKI